MPFIESSASPSMADVDLSRLSILLVDADMAMRALLRQLLLQKGMTAVTEVADGCNALELLDSGTIPEVVICAAQDMVIGGIELATVMRAHGNSLVNSLPLILVSGTPISAEMKASARGVDISRILVRPLSADQLAASIAEVAGVVPDWDQNDPI